MPHKPLRAERDHCHALRRSGRRRRRPFRHRRSPLLRQRWLHGAVGAVRADAFHRASASGPEPACRGVPHRSGRTGRPGGADRRTAAGTLRRPVRRTGKPLPGLPPGRGPAAAPRAAQRAGTETRAARPPRRPARPSTAIGRLAGPASPPGRSARRPGHHRRSRTCRRTGGVVLALPGARARSRHRAHQLRPAAGGRTRRYRRPRPQGAQGGAQRAAPRPAGQHQDEPAVVVHRRRLGAAPHGRRPARCSRCRRLGVRRTARRRADLGGQGQSDAGDGPLRGAGGRPGPPGRASVPDDQQRPDRRRRFELHPQPAAVRRRTLSGRGGGRDRPRGPGPAGPGRHTLRNSVHLGRVGGGAGPCPARVG